MNAQLRQPSLPVSMALLVVRELHRYLLLVLAAGLLLLWLAPSASAEPVTPAVAKAPQRAGQPDAEKPSREYLIKAAILFNLAKFATWPETAFTAGDSPVRICILGQNPFGRSLATLDGKLIGRRSVVSEPIADIGYAAACHILFVSASERERLPAILDAVSDLPVLTVADIDNFASAGGIVGLTRVADRSSLEINISAAKRAGVGLSSKLLRLADTVDTQSVLLKGGPKQ